MHEHVTLIFLFVILSAFLLRWFFQIDRRVIFVAYIFL